MDAHAVAGALEPMRCPSGLWADVTNPETMRRALARDPWLAMLMEPGRFVDRPALADALRVTPQQGLMMALVQTSLPVYPTRLTWTDSAEPGATCAERSATLSAHQHVLMVYRFLTMSADRRAGAEARLRDIMPHLEAGRAAQLARWGLRPAGPQDTPVVVDP